MAGVANVKIELTATPQWKDMLVAAFERGFDAGHYSGTEAHDCDCKDEAVAKFREGLIATSVDVGTNGLDGVPTPE